MKRAKKQRNTHCWICLLPLGDGEVSAPRCDGSVAHPVCWDIVVANLSEELSAFMRERPDLYREVKEGEFVVIIKDD